jgi:hypothetical protein
MGVIAGAMPGDRLDIGATLKAAGYSGLVEPDASDPADAFVAINNIVVVPDTATNTTAVTFDVMFDSSRVNGSRISGFVLDLAFDASDLEYTIETDDKGVQSKAYSFYTDSRTYEVTVNKKVTSFEVLDLIVANPENGKISGSNSNQNVFNSQDIADATGKVLTVDLTLKKLVNSFQVGFDSGSNNSLSLMSGTAPALVTGSTKTGYAGGSPLLANVIQIDGVRATSEDAMPATPGDNQLRYVEVVESSQSTGVLLKFQFDTDPAVGKTALSPLIEADLLSTDLTAFLNTDYVKLI